MDADKTQRLITEKEKEINELRQESIRNLELQLRSTTRALEEARIKETDLTHKEKQTQRELQTCEEELNKSRAEARTLLETVQRNETAFKELNERHGTTLKELEGWITRVDREKEDEANRHRQQCDLLRKELEKEKEIELQRARHEWKQEKVAFKIALQDAEKEMKTQKHELKNAFETEKKKLLSTIDQAHTELGIQREKQEETLRKLKSEEQTLKDSNEREIDDLKSEVARLKEDITLLNREKQSLLSDLDSQIVISRNFESERTLKANQVAVQTEQIQQLKNNINDLTMEFENRDLLHQQQMGSLREEAEYQMALVSKKLDQETQRHQEFVIRLESEREQLSSDLGSIRASSQVEFSRLKELHDRELLEMEKKFDESADQRTAALKEVREHLLVKEKEVIQLNSKTARLQQSIEERDGTILKFKACLKEMQLRYGDMEVALKKKVNQISNSEGKMRSLQKEFATSKASLEEKDKETEELLERLDTNTTQIEKLKEIIKNLIKEKRDLMEEKEQKKREVVKQDQGTNTEVLTHCPPPPPPPSETCDETIPDFSLPSEEDLTLHTPPDVNEFELLQKENLRFVETVRMMTEELKCIKETMHQRKVSVLDKEAQTEACDLTIVLQSTQHELKEVEKQLKATYQHIKILEDRDSDETHSTEMNYLREQVRVLRQESLSLRRRNEQTVQIKVAPQEHVASSEHQFEDFKKQVSSLKAAQAKSHQQILELEATNQMLQIENAELMEISNSMQAELNQYLPLDGSSRNSFEPIEASSMNIVLRPSSAEPQFCLPEESRMNNMGLIYPAELGKGATNRPFDGEVFKQEKSNPNQQDQQHHHGLAIAMSDRYTESQKEKLRALLQQKQNRQCHSIKKVRNYNVKNDEEYNRMLSDLEQVM